MFDSFDFQTKEMFVVKLSAPVSKQISSYPGYQDLL